jgi:anti-sigma regulatory factor (Ser/Thr protein kinase)
VNEVARARFCPRVDQVRSARCFVGQHLEALDLTARGDDADTVITELATNAVIHARSVFEVRLLATNGVARIEVSDESSTLPAAGILDPLALSGRGLVLVQAVSLRWGASRNARGGKTVWSELTVTPVPNPTPATPSPRGTTDQPPTSEAMIDALLATWDEDLDGPGQGESAPSLDVIIPEEPVRELLAAKVHMEDLLREVQLMLIACPTLDSAPEPLRDVWQAARDLDQAAAAFSEGRRQTRAQAAAARARGVALVTLRLHLPGDAAATVQCYQQAVDHLQHLCATRIGPRQLVTIWAHSEKLAGHDRIRRRYLDKILQQLPPPTPRTGGTS